MSLLWISLLLVVAGIVFLLIELVVPGGVIGVVGLLLMMAGVIYGFAYDGGLGLILMIGSIIAALGSFWLWRKFFPDSKMGRKIFLHDDAREWHGYDTGKKELIGKTGTTMTILMPSGAARIGNDRIDVVTEGEVIEKGCTVEVVRVDVVRVDDVVGAHFWWAGGE